MTFSFIVFLFLFLFQPIHLLAKPSNWTTLDIFDDGKNNNIVGSRIGYGPNGSIYALGGIGKGSMATQVFVRKSIDFGKTWETVYLYPDVPKEPIFSEGAFAVDKNGYIYFATEGDDELGKSQVHYFQSKDSGKSWNIIFNIAKPKTSYYIDGMFADDQFLYSTIWTMENDGQIKWHLRKDTFSETPGTYLDEGYQLVDGLNSLPMGITISKDGQIFVSGYGTEKKELGSVWLTKAYDSKTSKWTISDKYQYKTGLDSYSVSLVTAPNGNIFSAGVGTLKSERYWIVRKFNKTKKNWYNVDVYKVKNSKSLIPTSMKCDSKGNIYIAGILLKDGGAFEWIVRRGSPNGKNWQTIDQYQLTKNRNCMAASLIIDLKDNVYAIGTCDNEMGLRRSVIRKLEINPEINKSNL